MSIESTGFKWKSNGNCFFQTVDGGYVYFYVSIENVFFLPVFHWNFYVVFIAICLKRVWNQGFRPHSCTEVPDKEIRSLYETQCIDVPDKVLMK